MGQRESYLGVSVVPRPCLMKKTDTQDVYRCGRRRCGRTLKSMHDLSTIQINFACIDQAFGLGDVVAKAIETIMPWTKNNKCQPCQQRQAALNALGRKITGRG
jgi:hypothetical protein